MKHAYICWCRDSVHAEQLRRDTLAAHLAYVETIMDRVLIAGALRDEDNQISGSCLIYDAASQAEALALLQADPYHRAGVWSEVTCRKMGLAAGKWIGGSAW